MINFCYALLDSRGAVESKNNISSKIYFKRSKQLNWSTAEFQSFQCTFFSCWLGRDSNHLVRLPSSVLWWQFWKIKICQINYNSFLALSFSFHFPPMICVCTMIILNRSVNHQQDEWGAQRDNLDEKCRRAQKSSGRQHISVSLFFTFLSLHSKVPHTDGFVTLMMIKTVFQIRLSVCFLCVLFLLLRVRIHIN